MDKWISVKDKLPESQKEILFYDSKTKSIVKGLYYKCKDTKDEDVENWQGHLNHSFTCYYFGVTHWMPLPAPPKEEK